MKEEKNYILKAGSFYLSTLDVDFGEIETDFISKIIFVTKGNGELVFNDKEQAELFAKKIFINLGLACKVVEDTDE